MQEDQSVLEMFHMLNSIINEQRNFEHKVDNEDFYHQFLRFLPRRFDTLFAIIVRGELKGLTRTQVLGDVVTKDTYHVKRDMEDNVDEKNK